MTFISQVVFRSHCALISEWWKKNNILWVYIKLRCLTCTFVVSRTTVTGPKSTLNITEHFNCRTPNIIYCIQCSNCKKLYIGETGRRLGDRIRDHLYDIRKNDLSKPISRHFNSSNHSISDFVAFGLSIINGGNDCRKTKEMRLIHALGTLNPHGINERFTFC